MLGVCDEELSGCQMLPDFILYAHLTEKVGIQYEIRKHLTTLRHILRACEHAAPWTTTTEDLVLGTFLMHIDIDTEYDSAPTTTTTTTRSRY